MPRLHEALRVIFCVFFLIFRTFYWPIGSFRYWRDALAALGGAAPVHSTPCHVFILAANVGLTGLQFYWTKLILEGLAAKLAESDASAKPKSRAKSPAKGLKGA